MNSTDVAARLGRQPGAKAVVAGVWVAALAGCSAQQWYAAGREAQRTQCHAIQDSQQRQDCLRDADTSYDRYQRQSQAVKP